MKIDGDRCGSPSKAGHKKCHFHMHIQKPPERFVLPPLEDANSIQVGVMEVMRALLEGRIERGSAGILLYALQIAQSNLRNITLVGQPEVKEEDEESIGVLLMNEIRLAAQEEREENKKKEEEQKEKETRLALTNSHDSRSTRDDQELGAPS